MIFQLKQKFNLFCLRNALLSFSKLTAPDVWIKNPSSGDFQLNLLFKSHLLRFFASMSEFSWTPFPGKHSCGHDAQAELYPSTQPCPTCQPGTSLRLLSQAGAALRGFLLPVLSLSPACISQTHESRAAQAVLAAPASQHHPQCGPWEGRGALSIPLP